MTIKPIQQSDLDERNRKLWLNALTALERKNMDYAIELMSAVVAANPGFLEGRKALRKVEIQRKKGEKKKLFTLSGSGLGLMKLKSQAKSDPAGALVAIEKALENDPFNIEANDLLHLAGIRLEWPELAAFALEVVREGHPDNTKKMHELAQYYMSLDEPEKAAGVYAEITRKDPTDMDAVKGGKDATARASMRKGRWEEGFKASMKDEGESANLEAQSRTGMTREQLQAQLDKALEEYTADQNSLKAVKSVAALYERLEDWQNAKSFYEWAFHLSNGDTALERKAAAMDENRIESEIAAKERKVNEMPDGPEAQAEREVLQALKQERNLKLIAEARERVERNPTDPQLRFEYGQHLYNGGEYTEAIPQLQRARTNPHLRTRTLLLLGMCYEAKGMNDLARNQLDEALSELAAMDGTKKEVLYRLALVCQKMGRREDYLEYLKRIYEADYGYRDVAKRVEESYVS